ncbi:MAG TPA: PaaI family thioesterase [Burkholderiales bacterium]|nr:PaaI family thioesterase [Burkholderiales bacterium]
MHPIPEGFKLAAPRNRPNPFNQMVGPFYEKREGKTVSLGLYIEEKHTNSRGICHGGLLATMADLALGYACLAIGGQTSFVTVSLTLDYAGSARPGDWVQSIAEVQKTGSRLAFANCYLAANEVRIVRASAIFALSGQPK